MLKDKENLEVSKVRTPITRKGTPVRLTANFSLEAMGARRQWMTIKVLRKKATSKTIFEK